MAEVQLQAPEPTGDPEQDHAAREDFVQTVVRVHDLCPLSKHLTHVMAELGTPPVDPSAGLYDFLSHSVGVEDATGKTRVAIEETDDFANFGISINPKVQRTGAFLHDAGKIGPPEFALQSRFRIGENPFVKFFNINFDAKRYPPTKTLFKVALHLAIEWGYITLFDAECLIEATRMEGLDPNLITLRTFYNLHSRWSGRALRNENLPDGAWQIGENHHLINRSPVIAGVSPTTADIANAMIVEFADKAKAILDRPHNSEITTAEEAIDSIRTSIQNCTTPTVKDIADVFMARTTKTGILQRAIEASFAPKVRVPDGVTLMPWALLDEDAEPLPAPGLLVVEHLLQQGPREE